MVTIVRAYIMYKPYVVFGSLGFFLLALGIIPMARFAYFAIVDGNTSGHLQSLLLGAVILIGAFLCFALNIIADLIRINRILIEESLEQSKRARFK
jgi:hypothetical protein